MSYIIIIIITYMYGVLRICDMSSDFELNNWDFIRHTHPSTLYEKLNIVKAHLHVHVLRYSPDNLQGGQVPNY